MHRCFSFAFSAYRQHSVRCSPADVILEEAAGIGVGAAVGLPLSGCSLRGQAPAPIRSAPLRLRLHWEGQSASAFCLRTNTRGRGADTGFTVSSFTGETSDVFYTTWLLWARKVFFLLNGFLVSWLIFQMKWWQWSPVRLTGHSGSTGLSLSARNYFQLHFA